MDTKKWLEEIKREMDKTLRNMQADTLPADADTLAQYVKILEALGKLSGNQTETNAQTEAGEMHEVKDEINHVYIGRFKRELSGGTIGSFRIFVPESIVRNLRLEHGDWVRAKAIKSVILKNGNLRTMYDYSLAQKAEEKQECRRRMFAFAETRYDPYEDLLYIEEKADEDTRRIPLADNDIRNLDIGEGDLIDYAYYENELEKGRAVWKYKLPGKPVEPGTEDTLNVPAAQAFFPARSYVIVGELQDALRVQEEIEEYGGDVSFLTGDERFDIMERIGTAGDTVVVVLDALTPHGLSKINDISEKYRLPVLYTKNTDAPRFLTLLMETEPITPHEQGA